MEVQKNEDLQGLISLHVLPIYEKRGDWKSYIDTLQIFISYLESFFIHDEYLLDHVTISYGSGLALDWRDVKEHCQK